ncbi:hypothetical protein KL949_000487 [Ogataea haglerorum]|nr:hypothetical protein KL913_000279 [Ogataea haglerorum]KAG7723437.1 hypothetical protein KL949_000487 [Ogataea haglerorum]KAG7771939.1 hypothetical protein KL931_000279 [Ogataea haglerorum]
MEAVELMKSVNSSLNESQDIKMEDFLPPSTGPTQNKYLDLSNSVSAPFVIEGVSPCSPEFGGEKRGRSDSDVSEVSMKML